MKPTIFQQVMLALEEPVVSEEYLYRATKFAESPHLYNPIFEAHVGQRIHEKILPQRLLNIAYHLEWSPDTHSFGHLLNHRVASSILYRDEGWEHLYYMCQQDQRSERHVLPELIKTLSDVMPKEAIRVVDTIAPNIGIDRASLFLRVITKDECVCNLRQFQLLSKLSIEDQYLVWVRSLETNSKAVNYFSPLVIPEVFDYIEKRLHQNKDDDLFAIALSTSNIPIPKLDTAYRLNDLLELCISDIPQTIDRLYRRAEEQGRYEYLLLLGRNKNKKDLLRSILKSKNHELIDRFFDRYKNSPEVRHLVPFL